MTNPEIDKYGSKTWYNSQGEVHREDGPAFVKLSGLKVWLIHGSWHREDGPAMEWPSGRKDWYINGQRIT